MTGFEGATKLLKHMLLTVAAAAIRRAGLDARVEPMVRA